MSASDALNEQQFVSHTELANMYSGDFDVPMHKLMQDRDFHADEHPMASHYGGHRRYVDRLARSISVGGMKEPIEVRGGNVITDGHHRALAAMKLGLDKVPVRHIR